MYMVSRKLVLTLLIIIKLKHRAFANILSVNVGTI